MSACKMCMFVTDDYKRIIILNVHRFLEEGEGGEKTCNFLNGTWMLKGSTWHHTEARRMKIRNLLPIRNKTFVVNKSVPLMMTISSVAIYFKSNRAIQGSRWTGFFNNLIAMIIWDTTQLQTTRVQFTEVICRIRFSREPLPFNLIDLPHDWINSF